MMKHTLILSFLIFVVPCTIHAEINDSLRSVLQPIRKNIIKSNPTPMILWDWKNVTFSYERILNPR